MFRVITAIFTMLLLDSIWLGIIAKKLYITEMSGLLRLSNGNLQPVWPAVAVVYCVLILGLFVFVIPKSNGNALLALGFGALFGFITYAIYDFTSLAILSNWSLKMSLVDTAWGMILCGVTSFVTVFVAK